MYVKYHNEIPHFVLLIYTNGNICYYKTYLLERPKFRTLDWVSLNEEQWVRIHFWWEFKVLHTLERHFNNFFTKLKILLVYNPSVTLLGFTK
jgi:hypothetical protein